ncbi:response regulator transcription factor [Nocardia sp. NPDC056064]|uniref:response regulator transcription factor n=1 Tax=Nocardia sp. NPDC056064 TaxID=3345701 RepID=UPI0035D770DB
MTVEYQPHGPVLVVDDDEHIRESLERGLTLLGFDVSTATDGIEAIRAFRSRPPSALVLDMQMPNLDGLGVIRALRALGSDVPICVLSARARLTDRVEALEAGADDYLLKPFVLAELAARLRAVLRRAHGPRQPHTPMVGIGPLLINESSRRVTISGSQVSLTRREFELLRVLAEHRGQVVSREQLLELVWGYDFPTKSNVVEVFISHLRRKLEFGDHERLIHTIHGTGYVLRSDMN